MDTINFVGWLETKGIQNSNYTQLLERVESAEGNLDQHYDADRCQTLLNKLDYTMDDRNNKRENPTSIEISTNGGDLYKSFYEMLNAYRSRVRKYVEFKDESKGMTAIDKIKNTYNKLLSDGKFISTEELENGYTLFNKKFGPDVLRNLDGEELINTMFYIGNRDGLTYWLEFKMDEEFKATTYGSIAGGSAYKFIMFKRKEDDKWVTGSASGGATVLSSEEAISLGKKVRDGLLRGVEIVSNLSENATVDEYISLQKNLDEIPPERLFAKGWIHKYLHMVFRNKIDTYYNTNWQKHMLLSAGVKALDEIGSYAMGGQIMQIIRELGIPTSFATSAMNTTFGSPVNCFRIGTTTGEGTSLWDEMKTNNVVSIGWHKLGDISSLEAEDKSGLYNRLKAELTANFPTTPQQTGRDATQILNFYRYINIGDIVVAAEGQRVLGVGKVTGKYQYNNDSVHPHQLPVQWRFIDETTLPNVKEGLRTTVFQYKDSDNIQAIINLLNANVSILPNDELNILLPLDGLVAQIENVLSRKKQVILYGPPGTGKTYYAEKACFELASRHLFNKSYDELSSDQREKIKGKNGVVKICCFHPSYGYEDFIEGIKPKVVENQTVFELREGIFKSLCLNNNPSANYYIIIDEINRGDISRIFGELITLIEGGKRGKEVVLPLSKDTFSVPQNIYIVGTMNTADRSITNLDAALRRRFGFIELMPDYSLFANVNFDKLPLSTWLKSINKNIVDNLGKDARNLQIGHSYFMEGNKPITDNDWFMRIVEEDVIPLIDEYCYGDYSLIEKIMGTSIVDSSSKSIRKEIFDKSNFTGFINALLSHFPTIAITDIQEVDESEESPEDIEGDDQ